MILKSNYKDYYDGCFTLNTDDKTLFIRNRFYKNKISSPENFISVNTKESSIKDICGTMSYIIFAGQFYPCKIYYQYGDQTVTCIQYYYREPDDSTLDTIRYRDPVLIVYDQDIIKKSIARYIKNLVRNPFHIENKTLNDLIDKFGDTFLIHESGFYNRFIEINPILSKYGLQKILPPIQAYNQLYVYLNNKARPEKPIPIIDNDTKIHLAGFDTKKSFRKEKS